MKIIDFKLQPSDIGAVLPLGQNVIIKFNNTNEIIRTKSNNIIDDFIFGKFDEYEILSMGSVKYGWLEIILAKIDN